MLRACALRRRALALAISTRLLYLFLPFSRGILTPSHSCAPFLLAHKSAGDGKLS